MSLAGQIRSLSGQGYGKEAICARLGITPLSFSHNSQRYRLHDPAGLPDGYITISRASELVGLPPVWLWYAIKNDELRIAWFGGVRCTTMEWVQIWINNANYRTEARELERRLYADSRKPSQT
jgi:hypothetical protein